MATWWRENVVEPIHRFRIPIRNPRVLFAVKCIYFVSPIVVGYHVMQAVIPDPDKLRGEMKPPSEYAAGVTERQKKNLQQALEGADAAFKAHKAAEAQKATGA